MGLPCDLYGREMCANMTSPHLSTGVLLWRVFMLLPFTTGRTCSFTQDPKIGETVLNPAWSGSTEGLTYKPRGKGVGLLLETMEIWAGRLFIIQHITAEDNTMKQTKCFL